jgi:hypothetical protein
MRARNPSTPGQGVAYILASVFLVMGLFFFYFQTNFSCTIVEMAKRRGRPAAGSTSTKALSAYGKVLALRCENNNWFARLGNNMLSIISAAGKAHSLGMRFGIVGCEHSTLNLTTLLLPDSSEILMSHNPEEAYHLYMVSFSKQDQGEQYWVVEWIFPSITACISRDIARSMLSHLAAKERKYSEDALVIHIRSGDIMPGGNLQVHPLYAPPPLSYYIDIIDQHLGHREVVIVTEKENMNPVVGPLMELYPDIKLQTGSLEEDISVILQARYLVASHSTFAWSLALGSPNIELLYTFKNGILILDDRAFGGTKVIQYYTDDYLKKWFASQEQLDYLINFPQDQLKQKLYANDYACHTVQELFPVDGDDMVN